MTRGTHESLPHRRNENVVVYVNGDFCGRRGRNPMIVLERSLVWRETSIDWIRAISPHDRAVPGGTRRDLCGVRPALRRLKEYMIRA